MARVAAVLPGYATVRQSSGVLHLAPRSVRDLIYAGRLPSVRLGRVHFVRATDLELERRRRLGLRLPNRTPRARKTEAPRRPRLERGRVDPSLRRERAAERAVLVSQWVERHHPTFPDVPFAVMDVDAQTRCAICGRTIRVGTRVVQPADDASPLCLTCGRRALLDWADHRRLEAAAARRVAEDLGASEARRAA